MKKVILIFCSILLLILVGGVGATGVVSSAPFQITNDIVKQNNNTNYIDPDFYGTLKACYENGYLKEYYLTYIHGHILKNETKKHQMEIIIPLAMLGETTPQASTIRDIEKMLYNGNGKIDELSKFASKLSTYSQFKKELKNLSSTTILAYLESSIGLNNKINSTLEIEKLPSDYLEQIGKGWAYPFLKYHRVTAGVGMYNPFGEWLEHPANDFGASEGTPVYAVKSGTVIGINKSTCATDGSDSTACFVIMLTDDNLKVMYYHFAQPFIGSIGERYNVGDFVGYVGETGMATGAHLHLEIRDYNSNKVLDYCQLVDCDNPKLPNIKD